MGLTGSGLGRARACPASVLLPQTYAAGGKYERRGNVVHEYLASAPTLGRDGALANAPEDMRVALGCIELDALPVDPGKYAAEVCFRYDVRTDTAHEVSRGASDRAYERDPDPWHVWGTADVVGMTADAVVVGDYKTGWSDLGPVRDNWQLRFYALAACRAYGRDRAIVFIIRIREDGSPWYERAELSALDLDATAHSISVLVDQLEDAKKQDASEIRVVEGAHCRYCRAFAQCPAKATLAAALGRGELAPPVLDASNALAVYERAQAAKEVIARVEASLEEYARLSPIDLGNGWVYGQKELPSEKIDALLAQPILKAHGLADAIETTLAVKKDRLKDEIRKSVSVKYQNGKKPRGILGETFDQVLGELRAAKAAITTKSRPVMKHRPKAAELPEDAPL